MARRRSGRRRCQRSSARCANSRRACAAWNTPTPSTASGRRPWTCSGSTSPHILPTRRPTRSSSRTSARRRRRARRRTRRRRGRRRSAKRKSARRMTREKSAGRGASADAADARGRLWKRGAPSIRPERRTTTSSPSSWTSPLLDLLNRRERTAEPRAFEGRARAPPTRARAGEGEPAKPARWEPGYRTAPFALLATLHKLHLQGETTVGKKG